MAETDTKITPSSSNTTLSSSTVSRTILLILRVLTSLFLCLAFILLTITKETTAYEKEFKFKHFRAYRYMMSTIVIGSAYNNTQLVRSIYTVVTGNHVLSGDGGYMIDFLSDKIASYVLLSGSAAGFGASEDLHRIFKANEVPLNSFFGKANASASLLLLGFVFTAIASICTSLALPKKV